MVGVIRFMKYGGQGQGDPSLQPHRALHRGVRGVDVLDRVQAHLETEFVIVKGRHVSKS